MLRVGAAGRGAAGVAAAGRAVGRGAGVAAAGRSSAGVAAGSAARVAAARGLKLKKKIHVLKDKRRETRRERDVTVANISRAQSVSFAPLGSMIRP